MGEQGLAPLAMPLELETSRIQLQEFFLEQVVQRGICNRSGDLESFLVATTFDCDFKDSINRIRRVSWGYGALQGLNQYDGWSLDLESRFFNHSTDCFAAYSS